MGKIDGLFALSCQAGSRPGETLVPLPDCTGISVRARQTSVIGSAAGEERDQEYRTSTTIVPSLAETRFSRPWSITDSSVAARFPARLWVATAYLWMVTGEGRRWRENEKKE